RARAGGSSTRSPARASACSTARPSEPSPCRRACCATPTTATGRRCRPLSRPSPAAPRRSAGDGQEPPRPPPGGRGPPDPDGPGGPRGQLLLVPRRPEGGQHLLRREGEVAHANPGRVEDGV